MGRVAAIGLLFLALLGGCANGGDIATGDDDSCQSYGAQPGSSAYFQCRMAKDQQRQGNNAALAAAWLNRPQPQQYMLQPYMMPTTQPHY